MAPRRARARPTAPGPTRCPSAPVSTFSLHTRDLRIQPSNVTPGPHRLRQCTRTPRSQRAKMGLTYVYGCVHTEECVCTTMIADGFQPQTCAGPRGVAEGSRLIFVLETHSGNIWPMRGGFLLQIYCIFAEGDCGDPGAPAHGTMTALTDFSFGAVVKYECEEGFVLIGSEERKCQADGTWSCEQPRCLTAGGDELL